MIFIVKYNENKQIKSIDFEVCDLETCKKAVSQWRVNEKRLKRRTITINSINLKN